MKILKTIPHLTDAELLRIRNKQKDIRLYNDWQIIYSVQTNEGEKAEKIARILGINVSKIYRIV
ncbi:hypothetical protein FACS1894156_6500 [Bacteroidia bacterium]|nr:hypothetical protein FACS1894156_6500 [Bacteroidia bacterium]